MYNLGLTPKMDSRFDPKDGFHRYIGKDSVSPNFYPLIFDASISQFILDFLKAYYKIRL